MGGIHPGFKILVGCLRQYLTAGCHHNTPALFDFGYIRIESRNERPTLAFEVKPVPGEDPEFVLEDTKRVWKEAWFMAISEIEERTRKSSPRKDNK